jgi:signal transduction histidine kinase
MQALGWLVAAGFAVALLWLAVQARRTKARRAEVLLQLNRLEQEQNRMLQGMILAQEAASRILMPGELTGTVGRIAHEAVDLLGVEGACVFVRPPEGTDEPTDLCAGHFPDGMADPKVPASEGQPVPGFGSILSIPIRLGNEVLGEFRLAEKPGHALNVREVHIARLLAQLVAIAAQYRIQRNAIDQAEEDKRRFILATTHDLRAPVTTIEQLTQAMREGYAGEIGEKPRELIDKIHGRAEQLLELLSDLLNLAAEQQDIGVMREKIPVSLSAIFDAQVEAARAACEARLITLTAHRPDLSLTRMAAKGDLEKILSNLLSNAVKYTLPGGRIDARIEDSPGGILFRVKDTGIGIPKDSLPKLFTEYFRATNAREMERHGTGLGLALVQRLVRKYGGRIRVDSVLNRGTLVEVLLPPE